MSQNHQWKRDALKFGFVLTTLLFGCSETGSFSPGNIGATGFRPATGFGTGGSQSTQTAATGTCCSGGDCICREAPRGLTGSRGPYRTDSYDALTGTVYYPTNAEPPFAAVALCGGFLNTGPEMESWGPFYASHGIVTIITRTGALDFPDFRGTELLGSIEELKQENNNSSSPLYGKMAGRYGTSGYSMGGGGTTFASLSDTTLKTSVGLAPWGGTGANVTVPTMVFCGTSDTVAPCIMSQGVYAVIDESVPKALVTVSGSTHFNWFGPDRAGPHALAFQKAFLEGDERWRSLVGESSSRAEVMTNIN